MIYLLHFEDNRQSVNGRSNGKIFFTSIDKTSKNSIRFAIVLAKLNYINLNMLNNFTGNFSYTSRMVKLIDFCANINKIYYLF